LANDNQISQANTGQFFSNFRAGLWKAGISLDAQKLTFIGGF
jgi:hypothetical protein